MKLDPELIRQRRTQLGLTKRDVCDQAEIPMSVITRLELNGEIDELTVRVTERILTLLHLTLFEASPTTDTEEPAVDGNDTAIQAIGSFLFDRRSAQKRQP
jgi:transcriptional regulator with XRE-family HTH domain